MSDASDHRAPGDSSRGLLCVECEHLNPANANVCERCDAELRMECLFCGSLNERIWTRCKQCRQHLHQRWWRRWLRRLIGARQTAVVLLAMFLREPR